LSGDHGLFGPGSVSWRIDREAVLLAGGTCAALLQFAHPAVAAGVAEHSDFMADPFGRLRRTLVASYDVVFGSTARAEASIQRVNALHRTVRGRVPETGSPYSALDPEALLWVHFTLVDTALRVYERFVAPLSAAESDAYHREAAAVAVRLGIPAEMFPATVAGLRAEMDRLIEAGAVRVTPTARRLLPTLLYPSRIPPRFVWDVVHLVSISMLPEPIRAGYGIRWNHRRERAVERLARLTRRLLPVVPPTLRYVPQARRAEARLRD
jgi:uncharacterized protein (DUF2236 family)